MCSIISVRKQTLLTDTVYQNMVGMRTFKQVQAPFRHFITEDAYMHVWYRVVSHILYCSWQEVRWPLVLWYRHA